MRTFDALFEQLPIVAILRRVKPEEVEAICEVLASEKVHLIEVPLNSPEPFESIRKVSQSMSDSVMIGAGTVTTLNDAMKVKEAGGQYIVSPNCDQELIEWSIANNLEVLPGVLTPTEAFSAVKSGARYLKCFPAGSMDKTYIKHLKTVLPQFVKLLAVGGVTPTQMKSYQEYGADGFGIGSDLYKPGDSAETVREKAKALVEALTK